MASAGSPREVVKLYLDWGNACDAPWAYRSAFADMLRRALTQVPLRDVLEEPERAWFDGLGPIIKIYRGCEAGRVRGLSWTTEIGVAESFARGKRWSNDRPTLVSALIPREYILALFLSREEREVVVDPRRLKRVSILPAPTPWSEALLSRAS
jgi:hypothetical protein